eukprot:2161398-Alexandrium_andersonii.AAC.1
MSWNRGRGEAWLAVGQHQTANNSSVAMTARSQDHLARIRAPSPNPARGGRGHTTLNGQNGP